MKGGLGRWSEPLVYGTVSMLLWMVPVFDRLHVESAAAITLTAFFTSGIAVVRRIGPVGCSWGSDATTVSVRRWIRILGPRIGWLLVPAALLTVSAAWAPNCDWLRGAGLFAAFSVPTVIFSAGLAAFFAARMCRPVLWVLLAGVVLAVLGPLFDLGLHPQFYTYSTVFGGVLGPIYDEELVLRPGFFAHRALTIGWGLFFLASRRRFTAWSLMFVLGIGGAHIFAGPLGLNTPVGYLRSTFDGHLTTEHFEIHYDPSDTDSLDLARIAEEHEFRYAQLGRALNVAVEEKILTFIYPDAETRARRTGARVTSVAPVWLRSPQIHVEAATFYGVFPHELAHVFSREFGLPILNASLHVGLVEGLAVALEPPDGGPTPDEQVAAAAWSAAVASGREFSVAERMESALSATGFWGGRGAVSYTTSGSFVRFLLKTYGPERFKSAYARGDFEAAYGVDLGALTAAWEDGLQTMAVTCRTAGPRARRRFSVPSLFERRCPHWVPPELKLLRRASAAARDGREREALAFLADLPADVRRTTSVRLFEADLIVERDPAAALALLGDSLVAGSPDAAALAGDALVLLDRPVDARARYAEAVSLESVDQRTARVTRIMRHALADYPEAVRVVRAAGADSAAVIDEAALPPDARPAAALVNALVLYGQGRFEAALIHAGAARVGGAALWPTGEADRYGVRLEALAAYRAGRFDLAEARAREAAALYTVVGDAPMAAVMEDLVARIHWSKARP